MPLTAGIRDAAFTNAWDFGFDTVTGNKTLYAKWTPELTLDLNTSGGTVSGGDTPSSGGDTYVGRKHRNNSKRTGRNLGI
jgi:hypothetical protein